MAACVASRRHRCTHRTSHPYGRSLTALWKSKIPAPLIPPWKPAKLDDTAVVGRSHCNGHRGGKKSATVAENDHAREREGWGGGEGTVAKKEVVLVLFELVYRNTSKRTFRYSQRRTTRPPGVFFFFTVWSCTETSRCVLRCRSVILPGRQFDPTPGSPKLRATARYGREIKHMQYYEARNRIARHRTRCARLSTAVIVERSGSINATARVSHNRIERPLSPNP